MKTTLAAALTAATLATPVMADEVRDCFTDTLDAKIQHFNEMAAALNSQQTTEFPLRFEGITATYRHEDKMQMIADCEASTGKTSNGFAEGIDLYSHNDGGSVIEFMPRP